MMRNVRQFYTLCSWGIAKGGFVHFTRQRGRAVRVRTRSSFAPLSSLMAMACSRGIDGEYQTLPPIGSAVPPSSYPGLSSETVTSASLQGAPAVIALWSSTCGASRDALASIRTLAADYGSRGVRVVLLADDADATAPRRRSSTLVPCALASQQAACEARSVRRRWDPGVAPSRCHRPSSWVVPA